MNIKLNDFKYRYDVYQMFNIYFPLDELKFSESEGDYSIIIKDNKVTFEYKDIKDEALENKEEYFKETIKKLIFKNLQKITKDVYPWGTLVGIRPSKIALKGLREGLSEEEIKKVFYDKHYALEEKAQLCIDVAKSEDKFVNKDPKNISIYIKALSYEIKEMSKYVKEKNLKIETIYFGGGTPTSINNEEFENLMNLIYNSFIKENSPREFTVECGRPDSITLEKLKTMKRYNVTRISINPQTMNDKTLKLIGRNHTSKDVIEKFKMAKDLGFQDINMDMIIGLPGEGLEEAKHTAKEILKLSPDSLTVHGLSLKRGSIMYENFILKKGLGLKSQEEIMKMYEESRELAKALDIKPYYMYRQKNMVGNMENLGYAKQGKECLYNIEMIEDKQTIIALGADAVTKVVFLEENRLERFANVKDLKGYTERIQEMVEGKIKLLNTLY